MADQESFLARWSRRKRDITSKESKQSKPESAEGEDSPAASNTSIPCDVDQPFDLDRLPPLDSIGPGSDVRPFLAANVPAALKRMALRRAWSTDPAIRDFIGLSENAWDFNAAGGAPGFGGINEEVVRQLAKKIVGESGADVPMPSSTAARCDQTTQHDGAPDPTEEVDDGSRGGAVAVRDQQSRDPGVNRVVQRDGADAAMQTEPRRHGSDRSPAQPRHGGALPK